MDIVVSGVGLRSLEISEGSIIVDIVFVLDLVSAFTLSRFLFC